MDFTFARLDRAILFDGTFTAVTPTKAGVQLWTVTTGEESWIPAFAGMMAQWVLARVTFTTNA